MAAVLGIGWTGELVGRSRVSWPLIALLVVPTEPFLRTFAEGQFATFSFALTAGAALSLSSNKDRAAGISTAAMFVKPHTAAGFGAAVLGFAILRRRWRFIGALGAAALGLAGLTQVLRPGWILEFIRGVTELGGSIPNRATIAVVVAALLLAVVVVLVRPRGADDAEILGLAVAFGLVVAPYAWDHDYVALAIPWTMIIGNARQLRPLLRRVLTMSTVVVAAPLVWVLAAVATLRGTESLSVVVPMLTVVLLALAIRWGTRRVSGAPSTS